LASMLLFTAGACGRQDKPLPAPEPVAMSASASVVDPAAAGMKPTEPRTDLAKEYAAQNKPPSMFKPQMTLTSIEVVSGKDKGRKRQIERVFKRMENSFAACYARAFKSDPSLEGEVVLRVQVERSGRTASTRMTENSIDPDVGICMLERAKRTLFPTLSKGEMVVDARFTGSKTAI
jgi:hypothetical protein